VSERTFLEEITIRSIGVIDNSVLEISKGLTVLSGETGAGKTMILTALNLILGGKADSSLVRKGSERLVASGKFSIPKAQEILFEDALIEDGELIVVRTVNADGKSKATTNGVSATASTLATFGENLVEVHGQAANHTITKASRQRELVDRFGSIDLGKYQSALLRYHDMKERIQALKKSIAAKDKELADLKANFESLNKAQRERAIKEALASRGVNQKISSFIPQDIDPTEESVSKWLEANADVFGLQTEEVPQKPNVDPAQAAAYKRMTNTVEQGVTPEHNEDIMKKLMNANTREELDAVIKGSGL